MINIKFPELMDAEAFIVAVDAARKQNKDKWVCGIAMVDGIWVEYKAYNTWIQIYRVEGVNYDGGMDALVREYKDTLNQPFKDEENAA